MVIKNTIKNYNFVIVMVIKKMRQKLAVKFAPFFADFLFSYHNNVSFFQ